MKIYLYCVSGGIRSGDVLGYAVTEDGRGLASHLSSSVEFSKHDMGLTSEWKHDTYQKACPEGYALEWVDNPDNHKGLDDALALNEIRFKEKQNV